MLRSIDKAQRQYINNQPKIKAAWRGVKAETTLKTATQRKPDTPCLMIMGIPAP